jgi:hypothetical protein
MLDPRQQQSEYFVKNVLVVKTYGQLVLRIKLNAASEKRKSKFSSEVDIPMTMTSSNGGRESPPLDYTPLGYTMEAFDILCWIVTWRMGGDPHLLTIRWRPFTFLPTSQQHKKKKRAGANYQSLATKLRTFGRRYKSLNATNM